MQMMVFEIYDGLGIKAGCFLIYDSRATLETSRPYFSHATHTMGGVRKGGSRWIRTSLVTVVDDPRILNMTTLPNVGHPSKANHPIFE